MASTVRGIDHQRISARLATAGCVDADSEASELLAAAPDQATLESWILRRERGEPLPWITGVTSFCGRTVLIDPGVFVPRWHTETLARRAAAVLRADGGRAVDLCTGAGAVAAHLASEAPDAWVMGTDLDVAAVRCARRNGVVAIVADLGGPLRSAGFDVVTAVAPYVPTGSLDVLPSDVRHHEPLLALDGGDDGLDVVGRAAATAARLLRPGGWFLTEIGGDQAEPLLDELAQLGFGEIDPWHDDDGDLRGLAARANRGAR